MNIICYREDIMIDHDGAAMKQRPSLIIIICIYMYIYRDVTKHMYFRVKEAPISFNWLRHGFDWWRALRKSERANASIRVYICARVCGHSKLRHLMNVYR